MVKLQGLRNEYKRITSTISKHYSSVFLVDLNTCTYEILKVHPSVVKLTEMHTNAKDALKVYQDVAIEKEYRDKMSDLIDWDNLAERLGQDGTLSAEYRCTNRTRKWCRAQWIVLDVVDGRAQTAIFTIEDIQGEKSKDEKIEKQDNYINGLISNYDLLVIYNINTDICSHKFYSSVAPEDIKGPINDKAKSVSTIFTAAMRKHCHPDHLEAMLCYTDKDFICQVLKGKKRHTHRFLYTDTPGQYVWVEIQLIKFAPEDEEPEDIAVAYTNVDADERERRAQQDALEDVKDIVNSSDMGMWHISLVMGKKPRMNVDGKMRELLGLDKDSSLTEEEMYDAWYSRVHPDAVESVQSSVMRMITEGVRDENTYLWIHPTKGERYVRCGGTAKPIMGGHMLSGYHYDVTEHVIAEMHQKKITEEALAANKAKTEFLHNMIHEIRNPLNAIMGFSQLLGMPDGTWSEEEKEEHNKQIANAYSMLSLLIDDVLDIADSNHGNYIVNIAETNVNNVCRIAMQAAEFRKPKAVKMHFTTEVDDSYTIQSDGRRISQVLVNYLTNACKHTWAGEIRLHCSTTENPGKLTFSVTDTGEGVPPEMAEYVFERFTKHNAKVKGSGIGLNICSIIAEKLHGEVKLDTSYTNGARFVFIL
ncbi:MAG: PAS domain-containing sensor histidine kinase [Bacteroidales bacterium]|nr:PAS domain-containing sensor histidine kinase [Bacteroidales bacterium]